MIRLNCFFQATASEETDFYKDALRTAVALTEKSRKHPGCIAYDTFQSATRSDVFMICETWANEEVLAAHSSSEPFLQLVPAIHACGEMKIEKFEF